MIEIVQDIVAWAFLVTGSLFLMIGGLGLIRLPDFYTRLHAAGITDTMGAELLIVGMMVHEGATLVTVKLAVIGVFLFFTSPTATHAVANAAFVAGLKPSLADEPETDSAQREAETSQS